MGTDRRLNYGGLARLEWIQLLLFTFPMLFVVPAHALIAAEWGLALIFFLNEVAPSIALAIVYLFVGLVTAYAVDQWRTWASGVRAEYLSFDMERRLEQTLSETYGPQKRIKAKSLRWYPHDMLMGAHVQGTFSPTIVLSAGMTLGLLRKDPRATAILSHELAHIGHYDRLLPGLIGMGLIEVFGTTAAYYAEARNDYPGWTLLANVSGLFAYKLAIIGGLIWLMSRSREYYADADADQLSQAAGSYLSVLERAQGLEKERLSFFHPSISNRIEQARKGFPSLRTRWLWRLYFLAATSMSWLQLESIEVSDSSSSMFLYIHSAYWMGLVVLASEVLRVHLLKTTISFRMWLPGRRTMRYVFLLGGFLGAAYAGATTGNPMVASIVAAGVYAIFSALKGWSKSAST